MKPRLILIGIFTIIFSLALGFYWGKTSEHQAVLKQEEISMGKAKSPLDETPFEESEEPILLVQKVENLVSKEIKAGEGPSVDLADKVTLHYVARLVTGKVFDSSKRRHHAFEVSPGTGTSLLGLEMGIIGMQKGGRRRIIIPPHMGYGSAGTTGGLVPPDSVLVYDVEILDIKKTAPPSKN